MDSSQRQGKTGCLIRSWVGGFKYILNSWLTQNETLLINKNMVTVVQNRTPTQICQDHVSFMHNSSSLAFDRLNDRPKFQAKNSQASQTLFLEP